MLIYNYLFAAMYEYDIRCMRNKENIRVWPWGEVTVILGTNVLTLFFYIARLCNIEVNGKLWTYIIGACVGAFVGIYYYTGKRYKRIHEKYRKSFQHKSKIALWTVYAIYMAVSILLAIIFLHWLK